MTFRSLGVERSMIPGRWKTRLVGESRTCSLPLLALLVIALLAMVVFDIITVDEIKEFGVILGPLVALVSEATGFYYGTKG